MSSVKKSISVAASQDVAFRVFTDRMALWWPSDHHIGNAPLESIVLEPRAGGRWAERGADGKECDWGRVLAWDPPGRVVLAWQLDADFKFDAAFETEVEIRFVAEGEKRTRVELEHKHLERYGAREGELRASFDSKGGWQLGLDAFAGAAAKSAKKHFLLRLIPPRASFAVDMSESERRAMIEHVGYWTGQADRGTAIAFGPVADPNGGWGVAIVSVDDDGAIEKLAREDPAIRHAIGMRYEVLPMPRVVLGR
ncbi:MAG TPA: SRPBCC domain-containing protein [Polyangiaceae bacterium]|jgi:uncharacterized protein YndB with AHSA1/START domain